MFAHAPALHLQPPVLGTLPPTASSPSRLDAVSPQGLSFHRFRVLWAPYPVDPSYPSLLMLHQVCDLSLYPSVWTLKEDGGTMDEAGGGGRYEHR